MKQKLALLLAVLLILTLAGCGGSGEGETPPTTVPQTNDRSAPVETEQQTAAPETEAPETEAPKTEVPETEAPETENSETDAPETEAPATEAPETEPAEAGAEETGPAETEDPGTEASATESPETESPGTEPGETGDPEGFQELVVIDNDECAVRITGVDPDNFWGYTLQVFLENRSGDKTYTFSVPSAAVNGVSWDPLFIEELAPGKKMNEDLSFTDEELEALLQEFTDVELTFRVFDAEDWDADDAARETVHFYPLGKDRAAAYVREPEPTDQVLVDNERISVVVIGCDPEGFWGYTVKLFLVNKTDRSLMFSAEDVSVNGRMCDPYWATSIGPGMVGFSEMDWSESTFEENGITEVEEVEMKLKAYDAEDWFADDVFLGTVTWRP